MVKSLQVKVALLLVLALQTLVSSSEASRATVSPEELVASLGGESKFSCTPATSVLAVNVTWIVNGTSLSDTSLTNWTTGFIRSSNTGTLKFGSTTQEYNNTSIQCLAIINATTSDEMPSREAALLVQGPLSSVESLVAHFDGTNISLNWTAPFSFDLTFEDPDVTYCVDVVSSSTTLHSECEIVGTEFTHLLPPQSWCGEITVYVTSANVVGNGTRESMQISQALADYDPEVVNISVLSNAQYSIEMSVPVCSANLVIIDSDKGEEVFAVRESDLNIAGRHITFTTHQLKEKHSYDVIVRASNIAGYRLSEAYLSKTIKSISRHDTPPTATQGTTVSRVGIVTITAVPVVVLLGLSVVVVLVTAVWLIRRSRRRRHERQDLPVYILRGKRRGQKMSIKECIGNKITKVYKSENLPLRHTYDILHDT